MDPSIEDMINEVSQTEAPAGEETVETAGTETEAEQPAAPWWNERLKDEIEYSASKGTVKEPLEMVLKRASMGYNYSQRMAEINQKEKQWAEERSQLEPLKRWQEYEEYAKTNPEWNKHVQESWERRQQVLQEKIASGEIDPLHAEVRQLKDQLGELSQFKNQILTKEQEQALKAEDEAFGKEMTETKDLYKGLVDFDEVDELGRSLEYRVLEHGAKIGTSSFRAAFRDLYHDKLVGLEKAKALEETAKQQTAAKKQGIIGRSPTPTKTGSQPKRPSVPRSYEEGVQWAMDDLKAGRI